MSCKIKRCTSIRFGFKNRFIATIKKKRNYFSFNKNYKRNYVKEISYLNTCKKFSCSSFRISILLVLILPVSPSDKLFLF